MTNLNPINPLFLNDKDAYMALKYLIKNTFIFKLIKPSSSLEELNKFIINFAIYKKGPKAMHANARLRGDFLDGKIILFNGQLNSFNKYIDQKLFLELVGVFPNLTKKEYRIILEDILRSTIFEKVLANGSNVRTRG